MADWLVGRAGAVACVVSLGVLSAPMAYAQDGGEAKKPAMDKETQRKVLGLVKQANELFDGGEFDKAYTLYKEAYGLYPNAAILYRLAQSAEQKGSLREAARYYEDFVKQQPESEQGVKVAQVTLPELYAKVKPLIRLTSQPAGANIYIGSLGSEPIGSTPFETEELPVGKTRIIFRLDGYVTTQEEVEIRPADEREISVKLAAAPSGETPVASGRSNTMAILGWTSAGLGVAALATGGVLSGLSMGAADDFNAYDKRGGGASRAERQALKDDANGYYDGALACYIAGGLLAATGVALLVYDGMQDEAAPEAPAASLRVNAGWLGQQAWVGLEGRF
jgi:tetratricopeptide (TPR) repeat protein